MIRISESIHDGECESRLTKVVKVFGITIWKREAVETRDCTNQRQVGFQQFQDERVYIDDDDE